MTGEQCIASVEVVAELMGEHVALKKSWPDLNGQWTVHDARDQVIDFEQKYPLEGYRRLAFMMLDADVVAVRPSSVYRVLKQAGRIGPFNGSPSRKGTGFQHLLKAHEHRHADISYLNISGTFYYLASRRLQPIHRPLGDSRVDDRASDRAAHRASTREVPQCHFPNAGSRIVSDNGPQFIARDFKQVIRICGMTHVKTSPYYPQSNRKLERYHKTLKSECIRPRTPLSLDDARRVVDDYVRHYNTARLHSAIGDVTPADKLAAHEPRIFALRDRKLEEAREQRRQRRACIEPTPAPVKS